MGSLGFWHSIFPILALSKCLNGLANVPTCPSLCSCERVLCPEEYREMCQNGSTVWLTAHCTSLNNDSASFLTPKLNFLSVLDEVMEDLLIRTILPKFSNLRVLSLNISRDLSPPLNTVPYQSDILLLNLSNGQLINFPSITLSLPNLHTLNLSGNAMTTSNLSLEHANLEILDLSQNKFQQLSLEGMLPKLNVFLLRSNQLHVLPKLEGVPHLKVLDISNNLLSFNNIIGEISLELNGQACQVMLPSSITTLLLKGNMIEKVPENGCGMLTGLSSLKHLDLRNNLLGSISHDCFPSSVLKTLTTLNLDHNMIYYLDANAFDNFDHLTFLSLSFNRLQTVPFQVISKFSQLGLSSDVIQRPTLSVRGNPISCDCLQHRVWHFLVAHNTSKISKEDMICSYPQQHFGSRLIDLEKDDLKCYDVVPQKNSNFSCQEYQDCKVKCTFEGVPRPTVHWISPTERVISAQSIARDAELSKAYALSEDGHQLTINNLQLPKTGIYKCIANNSLSSAEAVVQVAVVLPPIGSLIAISVSVVSFVLAIVLNSVNLCCYFCQNFHPEREVKLESPERNKSKQKNSPPSSNANEYYKKYDFTCQQIFLDTLIKGAHTVKRTIHDARNSEFSSNVWEYALHLRDRLHIEFPSSVQFPRVAMPSLSMPSISMPSISMPSMPTFQSINTNIERLGTSVISRSHNLAMTVGSVFTLRWLRSGNSDNESDNESDVGSSAISHVKVQVHEDECSNEEKLTGGSCPPVPHLKVTKLTKTVRRKIKTSLGDLSGASKSTAVHFVESTRDIPQDIQSAGSSEMPASVLVVVDSETKDLDNTSVSTCFDIQELYQFETNV